ncbi:MAG: hypothetical protein K6F30_05330 [Lachnospiraceae bacterium]|nr:hypothetical protein [Lachnospiraceae bacterium]
MEKSLLIVFSLVVVSTAIDILYLLISLIRNFVKRKDRQNKNYDVKKTILVFLMMLFTPVIGEVFFFGSVLMQKIFFRQKSNLEGTATFDKTKVESRNPANLERDMNLVPMEEALAVSDKTGLRNLMLSVVKGDVTQYLSSITEALNSEDSETAHYAASVLRDELNNFNVHVTELRIAIEKANSPEKEALCDQLLSFMNVFLSQNVFHGIEKENYIRIMEEVGETYYVTAPHEMTVEEISWLCNQLMEIRDIELCEKWGKRSYELYSTSLPTYTNRLKLYFRMDDKEKFFETLEELKKSRITVDKETLEIIRMFREA